MNPVELDIGVLPKFSEFGDKLLKHELVSI